MLILEDQEPKASVENLVSQVSNTIVSLSKTISYLNLIVN